jgi:hypothetical protein
MPFGVNVMLGELIETARQEMFDLAKHYGYVSPKTVQASQKLDSLLDMYQEKYINTLQKPSHHHYVHGSIIKNFNDGLKDFNIEQPFSILLDNPEEWHPLNAFESLFTFFQTQYEPDLLTNMGRFVPFNCPFPHGVHSFEAGLHCLNMAYKLNHSHQMDGYYKVLFQEKGEVIVVCNTPSYPSVYNLGILKGLGEKFNTSIQIEELSDFKGGEFRIRF